MTKLQKYTKEQIDWLRDKYSKSYISRKELTKDFNNYFNQTRTESAIKTILKKNKILKEGEYKRERIESVYKKKKKQIIYTKEMIGWIRKNYTKNPDMTRKELIPLFNKTFNMNMSIMLMDCVIRRYKLASGFGRVKYTPKIKRFILKCVKKRMTRNECRIECEKKFNKKFNETNIGLVAKEMGIGFGDASKKMDAVFDIPEVEELIKSIIEKNPESTQQIIIIRDMLIEKYDKNISSSNIRKFCERKKIKLKTDN